MSGQSVDTDPTEPAIRPAGGGRRLAIRRHGERGGGLVEYGLLTALIALAAISALGLFGTNNESSIDNSAETVTNAIARP